MRKVVAAGMIGNGFEWYDFALYGQMAPILSRLFFPEGDPVVNLLLTYGVFAMGFVTRPLGAVLFGYIGDKYGRRTSLVISTLLMAISTGAIGLLPTYAQIGLLAPILLTVIRLCQGLSLAGEFSGSIVYVVEHSPPDKRGIIGATSIISLIVGFLFGSLVAMGFSYGLSTEDFEGWGWRIPFLFGIVIGVIGLYIRSHCGESPVYTQAKAEGHLSAKPVRDAFTKHPKEMFQAFGFYACVTMPFYLVSIYLISFAEKQLGFPRNEAFALNFFAMLSMLFMQPIAAKLSDRLGRRKIQLWGAAAVFLCAIPSFLLMKSGSFGGALAGEMLIAMAVGFYIACIPAMLVELFPTSVRYTGMSISYNACAAILGGTAPMACTWLITATGSHMSVAAYTMTCAALSFLTLLGYKDRQHLPLI